MTKARFFVFRTNKTLKQRPEVVVPKATNKSSPLTWPLSNLRIKGFVENTSSTSSGKTWCFRMILSTHY